MSVKNCSICGPNINTENIEFTKNESNLVYLDKVYSYNEAKGATVVQTIDTAAQDSLQTELIMGNAFNAGGNCVNICCNQDNSCKLDSNAVFNIERAGFLVESLTLSNPSSLAATDVTLEGQSVGSLSYQGGQFTAGINSILPSMMKCSCLDNGLPTKSYFMVENVGPWILSGVIFAEGIVTTGGKTCKFRLRIKNAPNAGFLIPETVNFVVPRLALPCSINGVAPSIRFSFGGNIEILGPSISISSTSASSSTQGGTTTGGSTSTAGGTTSGTTGGISGGTSVILAQTTNSDLTVSFSANFAIQPSVNVEVVRKTLFCLSACEAMIPCDGSLEQYLANLEEEEECDNGYPPCACGTKSSWEPQSQNSAQNELNLQKKICDCSGYGF